MKIDNVLRKYEIDFNFLNGYYYINDIPYLILPAQEVNNEPENLRVQTGNKRIQVLIRNRVSELDFIPRLWVIHEDNNHLRVAEFDSALDDESLLNGNKSLKFKLTDFGDPGTVIYSTMKYSSKLFSFVTNEVDASIDSDTSINIQPESDIYSYFKSFNYKPWKAISEFVDNSTASYFSNGHQKMLNDLSDFDNLKISIDFDQVDNSLTIKDNAFGMELSDFKRAFRLKDAPKDTSGRNEFGMGLKTASFWFGKKLTVVSTEFGSVNEYKLTLDTEILDEKKLRTLDIIKKRVPKSTHGTVVKVENIYPERSLASGRTRGKIKKELSTIFRRDILGVNSKDKSKKIDIIFDGDTLLAEKNKYIKIYPKMNEYLDSFKEKNSDYKYTMNLSDKSALYKKFAFSVEHNKVFYHVKCFIGYLNKTGASNAGLLLYRRGRVIEGKVDEYLKPKIIYGAPNSFESQRLFGEVDLEDIPVSQSKDSFLWSEDLQNKVFEGIRYRIQDLLHILRSFKKEDKLPEGYEVTESDPTDIIKSIQDTQKYKTSIELESSNTNNLGDQINLIINDELEKNKRHISEVEARNILLTKKKVKSSDLLYEFDGIRYKVIFSNIGDFINIYSSSDEGYDYQIEINISHSLFDRFSGNREFYQIITEFALAISTAQVHFEKDERMMRYKNYINSFISNRGENLK